MSGALKTIRLSDSPVLSIQSKGPKWHYIGWDLSRDAATRNASQRSSQEVWISNIERMYKQHSNSTITKWNCQDCDVRITWLRVSNVALVETGSCHYSDDGWATDSVTDTDTNSHAQASHTSAILTLPLDRALTGLGRAIRGVITFQPEVTGSILTDGGGFIRSRREGPSYGGL